MTIFDDERSLPPVWGPSGFSNARIKFYLNLCKTTVPVLATLKDTTCEFVAAMLLESGLDNLTIGNNAKNGSNNPWLGVGWCQLDTGYHVADLATMHGLRSDPTASLLYVMNTPDLCYVGKHGVYFNKKRWHAWVSEKIDPKDPAVWNPLGAVRAAWDTL